MSPRFEFSGGPLDGALVEGVDDTLRPIHPRIVVEFTSVTCPSNTKELGGFHLRSGEVLRHVYEFSEDADNPCYQWMRQEVGPDISATPNDH
jgi:hypothetical protein